LLLADHLVERARPHADGERRASVDRFAALDRLIEERTHDCEVTRGIRQASCNSDSSET
jgi:hypothetical protein